MMKLLGLSGILLLPNMINGQIIDACPLQGETPLKQKGSHNYVIDLFSNMIRFPFAINQCTATDPSITDRWYKYMCISQENSTEEYTITKTEYISEDCSDQGTKILNWAVASSADYNCDGMNTFVELQIGLSDCTKGVTVFAGLGACVTDNILGQYELYCNSSAAMLELYGSSLNFSETTFAPTGLNDTIENITTEAPINTEIVSTIEALSTSTTTTTVSTTSNIPSEISTTASSTTTTGSNTITTAQSSGRSIAKANIVSTWIATLIETQMPVCDETEFCDAWILPRRRCVRSEFSTLDNSSIIFYGQMRRCSSTTYQTTLPGKSSSIRPRLAISGLIALLLFVFLL